jgi:DNA repair protein SbcC/Rad50
VKLLRLKLENFRQHRDSEIQFRDGMTAIVGVNGSGKTTILEAITFALYGVQREKKESIKFYWAGEKSKVRVTLDFEFEGRRYTLDRTSNDASLVDTTEAAVTKATGIREVKAACERLLRLTYDQFKNSFCAEQKHLTFLQFNTDTRRQEQVAKMLGFDRLKSAADRARERGKIFRGISEQLAATMGDIKELRSDLKAASDELKLKSSVGKQMLELATELEKQLPAIEERKSLADEFFRLTNEANVFASNAEALKDSRKRGEETVAKAGEDVRKLRELTPVLSEYEKLEESLKQLQALREQELDQEKIQSEVDRLEAEITILAARVEGLKCAEVETLRAKLNRQTASHQAANLAVHQAVAEWNKAKQTAQANLSIAATELKQGSAALEKARALADKGFCPECGQPTTASFEDKLKALAQDLKLLAAKNEEAESAFSSVAMRPKSVVVAEEAAYAAEKECETARTDLTAAEKIASELKVLGEDLEGKRARIAEQKAQLSKSIPLYNRELHLEQEARLRALRPKREECLKLSGADNALKEAEAAFEAAKAEIEAAKSSYKALILERSRLPFESAEKAKEAVVHFESTRHRLMETKSQSQHAVALVKLCESRVAQVQERIAAYEQAEENVREGKLQALLHETAEKELKLLREALNAEIRPDLADRACENLSLLTNGRYSFLELDEEFNPTVFEDGIPKPVISGGEEDVVALALRMALSELIQERQGRPMSLLILDEVFGSLDAERRQAVLERLQSIKGRFAQILVISHIEEINQVADQCIFLTRDEETRSTVVGDKPIDLGELVLRA